MCGRFNIDFNDSDELEEIVEKVNRKINKSSDLKKYQLRAGDIYPTNASPIIVGKDKHLDYEASFWGFPNPNKKGVIINARSETVKEKRMFLDSLRYRRCVIPSTGFYEWDKEKRKYKVRLERESMLYMAGIYNYYENENRFVILTTAANDSMEKIHDRMPVILLRDEYENWLFDDTKTSDFLHHKMPKVILDKEQSPFEQISLF